MMSSTKRTGAEIMSVVPRVPLFSECSVICKILHLWLTSIVAEIGFSS